MGGYVFPHSWEREQARLALLEDVFDAATITHLDRVGAGPGWRCLEVGAGAGSVAAWLCGRVHPGGRVVATDVETDFLEDLAGRLPDLEVRRHDIVTDALEEGAFDLVHSRLVLEHLPGRDEALKRMVAALAPGGVALVEDFDWASLVPGPGPGGDVFRRFMEQVRGVMEAGGYIPDFGRRLPAALRDAGLAGVGAEGRVAVALAGSPATAWWHLNLERMGEAVVAAGALTSSEVDEVRAALDDEEFSFLYPVMVTAWGRRP